MDSDMARAHGHHYEQDFVQQPGEGGIVEEAPETPEKTSVFQRMKAKAKKVRASFGHKVHGNDGDGEVHDHEDEESDDDETAQLPTLGTPVYDSEKPRDFTTGQEGKPKGSSAEEVEQHVCPGTFQTKVTETDLLDPPSAIPPILRTGDDASSGQSKPTEQSNVTEEPKQAPTDFDARYGEHWGSLEATTDGNDSGALKSTSGDANQGHLKSPSGDVISPRTHDTTVGNVDSEPLTTTSGDLKSGRPNAALETFNAAPEDFTSGQGNAASGGFKSGDFNPKSDNFNSEPFNANSGDFNSGRQNAASDDYNSEAFNATPEDFTSGHLNVASGGFKSGDFNPKSDNFNSEPFNANSGDFNSGRQNAASDDHNSETFNATPEDVTSGQSNASSGGFKSGDFKPRASDAKTENFDSESDDFSSGSSKALGSGDLSSGTLRGALGGFSSFNSSHARVTSGDQNSQSNTPTHDFGSELNTTSPAHSHHDVSPNYSTNITSPGGVGSDEAKVDPISSSFAKMGIHGDQQHDEFCDKVESSPIPVPDFLSDKANTIPEHTEAVPPVPESNSPKTESHAKDSDVDISYPKDVDVDAHHPQDMNVDEVETPAETTNQGGYIASAVSAIAGKFGYGGNDDKSSDAPVAETPIGSTDDKSSDAPVGSSDEAPIGSTDYAVTERSPISTPQPQSGYVSSATSALTGAALSAKNAIASKLGYGGNDDTTETTRGLDEPSAKTEPETETTRGLDEPSAKTEAETETETGAKGYMAPGEDAKALSDYFTSAFHKPKGVDEEEKPAPGAGQTERVSDEERVLDPPMGKVTESDQVASRLGSSESEKTGVSSPGGAQSPGAGTGVVGKVKGAFTNWFGKAEEIDYSPPHGTNEEHLPKKSEL